MAPQRSVLFKVSTLVGSLIKILRTDIIPGISDHDAVYAEIDIKPVRHKQTPRKISLYKKASWDSMKTDMSIKKVVFI